MRVTVTTGSRLHLGFTNLSDDLGRCYGSLGVAIDRPSTTVVVEEGEGADALGDDAERVRAWRRRFCDRFGVDPHVSIAVRDCTSSRMTTAAHTATPAHHWWHAPHPVGGPRRSAA